MIPEAVKFPISAAGTSSTSHLIVTSTSTTPNRKATQCQAFLFSHKSENYPESLCFSISIKIPIPPKKDYKEIIKVACNEALHSIPRTGRKELSRIS
jgi:hypothetical protein